ncbi:hypothetical protein MHLP_01750 [Candidatus Mycoplasma haematolamae str. Purdue]|uniref:Uncharacterized protein n=1 Tax=Mycoplasma haematolamae (strain Purdue) TaxID=1212765 RepID=I7B9J8_MYCHA|nr:hypothetical protein [Candidatus Mycoplasma haematolamae]AFO51930.1 hypothetical protein MHLP_01750 [Candidatus Mycoplasma haematolamae str. Purdue]
MLAPDNQDSSQLEKEVDDSRDQEPKAGSKTLTPVDTRSSPVSDILSSPAQPSLPRKNELYKKGTRDLPDVICVVEDTGEQDRTWSGTLVKRRKPACIRKKTNLRDYEVIKSSPFCLPNVIDGLGSELAEKLRYRGKDSCRYWDSWNGPKKELPIDEEQTPEEFRLSKKKA